MSDYLPVMLSVDHPYPDIEEWTAERFKRLNGKEVFIVRRDMLPEAALMGHAAYAKAWLWDVVPKATTRFMFIDFDMIPLRALPEIPDAAFVAVPDAQWWIDTMKKMYPLFARTQRYFNSGFFVARRDTQPCFDHLKAFAVGLGCGKGPYSATYEQTPLNHLIQGTFDVHWLPETFNCMSHTHFAEASEAHMLHLAGMPNRSRWALMELFKTLLGTEPIQVRQQHEDSASE